MLRACRAPLTQIADNAGQDGGIVCEKVSEMKGPMGYNAATGVYEDLVKSGVIDPTKVTRSALAKRFERRHVAVDERRPGGRQAEERKKPPPVRKAATKTCIECAARSRLRLRNEI